MHHLAYNFTRILVIPYIGMGAFLFGKRPLCASMPWLSDGCRPTRPPALDASAFRARSFDKVAARSTYQGIIDLVLPRFHFVIELRKQGQARRRIGGSFYCEGTTRLHIETLYL